MICFIRSLVLLFAIGAESSINIFNITDVILLTEIFDSEHKTTDPTSNQMTYYINPNDPTNASYLWYGIEEIGGNTMNVEFFIKADIFTPKFSEYNSSNNMNLPLILGELNFNTNPPHSLEFSKTCTSPITKDIITCWDNFTYNNTVENDIPYSSLGSNIFCKIYFVQQNAFSHVIQITNYASNGPSIQYRFNLVVNNLCFKDAYMISYVNSSILTIFDNNNKKNDEDSAIVSAALLDLKGNIMYNEIDLVPNHNNNPWDSYIYTIKGGNNFNAQTIDQYATDLFMLNYITKNWSNIIGVYGYYTDINDTNMPIKIYNESILNNKPLVEEDQNQMNSRLNFLLNWRDNCCYISVHQIYNISTGTNGYNAIFTDIHGNHIQIQEYQNDDIQIVDNMIYEYTVAKVVDLPMISNRSSNYFLVYWVDFNDKILGDQILGYVYNLQYDDNNDIYHLYKEKSEYLLVTAPEDDINDNIMIYDIYNLPNTDYLFVSWTRGNGDYFKTDVYGQTLQVFGGSGITQ